MNSFFIHTNKSHLLCVFFVPALSYEVDVECFIYWHDSVKKIITSVFSGENEDS